MSGSLDQPPTTAELRAAQLAHVLARAVRDNEIDVRTALRVLRHELRRRNTNKKLQIPTRSRGAQAAIDKYGAKGVPKNGSGDALHADHVHPLTEATLRETDTVAKWIVELRRVQLVVCVTATENYQLEVIERGGTTGPAKYALAGIEFEAAELPWVIETAEAKESDSA